MIGGTYEYLISSLPNLSFQNNEETRQQVISTLRKYAGPANEELSLVEILNREAEKFLPTSVLNIFQTLNLRDIHKPRFQESRIKVLSAFSQYTSELKEEIKTWRTSQNENKNNAASKKVAQIIGEGTPLEKEINIMGHQWDTLEEISVGHLEDLEALFTYKIKLMILQRWWSFDTEKGLNKFILMTQTTEHGR